MSKTYFVNKYDDMFKELFSKKKDWEKIDNIKDISGEIDFCYNIDNNDIESKLKLISKYNSIEVNKSYITYDKIINIYILLISEKDIYIYKEGKVNADKVRYYSEQSYFNYTFEQIKYDVFNKINPFLEENKLPSNGFNIIGMKYGIDEHYKVNLLEIDTDLDLSIEIDKLHKMKLHYWLFFDILNKFVFKNNLHHRWEKCEKNIKILNKINKPKTYLINRSRILFKSILNSKGWIEGKINEEVDFSHWDEYDAKGVRVKSKVKFFPNNITSKMDNKVIMYETLKRNNLTYFLPKTYTDLKNIDKNIFENNKIYFLKETCGSGGKGVTVINTYEQITEIISQKPVQYILQEEVPNMYLDNGYKTAIRIYILITDKLQIFIYKEGKVYIYKELYSKSDLKNNIHNSAYNSNYEYFTKKPYYKNAFDKIKNICFLSTKLFLQNIKVSNCYQIMGYDFILDNDFNPYLIEINPVPNISAGTDIVTDINKRMITDYVNLYLIPKFDNVEPQLGDWELCM